jgi:dihydroflavonol-4-reductase
MNLVIGGTGLLGSHLVLHLLEKGEKVRVLRRSSSNINQVLRVIKFYHENAEEFFQQIEWIEGDILDYNSLISALDGVRHVYHCAAVVSFSPKDKVRMLYNNIEGTANVVNACLKQGGIRLCYVSSIASLGASESGEEITENHMIKPGERRTIYSISKFKSEMEVWRGIEEGLNAVIVNPSVILGPGDWQRSSGAFFPLVKNGLKYYTSGTTAFVDVRDVADIMVRLVNSSVKSERFIVSSENKTFREFFTLVAKALNVKAPKYEAGYKMLYWASKADAIISRITFSKRRLTSDTIISSTGKDSYSNHKVKELLNYSFRTVEEMVQNTAAKFQL